MALPQDFTTVLTHLGRAFEDYQNQSHGYAVLVGGAAVCLFTNGSFLSGDFDIVVSSDDAFDIALTQQGFRKEDRPGRLQRGYYHPQYPNYGVESVSGPLFDGLSDPQKLVVVTLATDSKVIVASIEDLIADRLGQYGANSAHAELLAQARLLYTLGSNLDLTYLRKRIIEDTGNPALVGL